ncbi:MAG: anaerobic ribonucleoside-triphosphate reductase [Thermoproteota archaeon]
MMPPLNQSHAVEVLKAVSSPVRLKILNMLFDKNAMAYTELMEGLKMEPSRDAGRFAYHLKVLLKADLITSDSDTKKYRLTRMGKMVVDVAGEIEEKAGEKRRVLVRTSRFSLEDFDSHKIVNSLIQETGMPSDTAQKVANKAKKRLVNAKTKYLTAPLIREVVNAVLIEEGLERYRHKLTRLGLPVYDTASLIENKTKRHQGSASVREEAGDVVLEEYTLLNRLPRDIADAHLSGALHINGLNSWILKPTEVMHDLRFFLKNGLNLRKSGMPLSAYPPPKSFESALWLILDVLLHSVKEVGGIQTLAYFNVFLAPYITGLKAEEVKEVLRSYLHSIGQHMKTSLGLEFVIPEFLAQKQAIGPSGKIMGTYGDYMEENRLLASLILEIFSEDSEGKPVLNPNIVLKIRKKASGYGEGKRVLVKAHKLALKRGIPYFANVVDKKSRQDVFSSSGFRLKPDYKRDWEIDTLRAGNVGYVTVNLPRIAHESEGEETRFFEILDERLEMSDRALEIKYRALRRRGEGLLPFITQRSDGDRYLRLQCSSRLLNFAGLPEAVETLCGESISEGRESLKLTESIGQYISKCTNERRKERGIRLSPAILPSLRESRRLAHRDIEIYGMSKVRFSGTKKNPFYSTFSRLRLQNEGYLRHLKVNEKLQKLHEGGSLKVVELGEGEYDLEELMSWSRRFVEKFGVEFFTYHRNLTYCTNCQKNWIGSPPKCPSCGSTTTLKSY